MQKAPRRHTPISLCDVWEGLAPSETAIVRREVLRILKKNGSLFDSAAQQQETLRNICALDDSFEKTGGTFFHIGADAFETARIFTEIHIERYRKTGRPSLPALAIHHAKHMGLDKKSAAYKALILVALRAEIKAAVSPEYHNKFHYMDVAAVTANLLEKNAEMVAEKIPGAVALTRHEQALTFIAAIGHDLDHEGASNPKGKPLLNEEKSFGLMKKLLEQAGLPAEDVEKIHTILKVTSPDGPNAVMKAAARAQRTGEPIDFSKADPESRFHELHKLAEDRRLTQMAAIVCDSDIYASSGAGLKASLFYSWLLTQERKKAGEPVDNLTSARSRDCFLRGVIGIEGYSSLAGRAVANKSFRALCKVTKKLLTRKLER